MDSHGLIAFEVGVLGPSEERAESLRGVKVHSDLDQDGTVLELAVAHLAVKPDQSFRHPSSTMTTSFGSEADAELVASEGSVIRF